MQYSQTVNTPCGEMSLYSDGESLTELRFCAAEIQQPNHITLSAAFQLNEYFCGKRRCFELPLLICGTAFQESVWREMLKIPYGDTIAYSALAEKAGKPYAARAVGNACNKNKLPIFIPCHRVSALHGIGGYAGGLQMKEYLLTLEHTCR